MKKLLIQLASGLVLDVLIKYAEDQYIHGGNSDVHHERWMTIKQFLSEMRSKGLPL